MKHLAPISRPATIRSPFDFASPPSSVCRSPGSPDRASTTFRTPIALALATTLISVLGSTAHAQSAQPPSAGTPSAAAASTLAQAPAPSAPSAAPPATEESALPDVVVTANPLGSASVTPPASVLQGRDLLLRQGRTLGETLDGLPGVSSTSFGPGASRPIIRGLDGDRIRLLQNGVGALDASALSYDHAVPQDMLSVDRIEVLRGPAALLYGGSAIGGVVNTIDARIPREAMTGIGGQVDLGYGGAARESSTAARVFGGNGNFAINADYFHRHSSDLRIPGYAWSDRQRAGNGSFTNDPATSSLPGGPATAYGRLPNSNGDTEGGSLGGSWTTTQGYAGFSYSGYQSEYGSVAEPGVRLRMRQDKLNFATEQRNLRGPFSAIKATFGYTDYEHKEIEDGSVGTIFKNRGFEARLEARHAPIGKLEGTWGLQVMNSTFSALGEEAFVPSTRTRNLAVFAVEEYKLQPDLTLSFGARYENTRLDPQANANPVFANDSSRSFSALSAATGAHYKLDKVWTLDANLAYTERAPTYYELYANGEHVATGSFERGAPDADKERSVSTDLGIRFDNGKHSGRLGAYYTRFQNYLGLNRTGQFCGLDANGAQGCSPGLVGGLPEYVYAGVPAQFYGLEMQGRVHLGDANIGQLAGHYDLDLRGDLTRATNRETGEALPRIPPARLAATLNYTTGNWRARVDVQHAFGQNRVPANDVPTDGYTLVGASLTYTFKVGATYWEAYLKGSNLTNQEARLATSVLRDIAPLGGRAVWVGTRVMF